MQCSEPTSGCTNTTAPGSAFCSEHPYDDLMFTLRAMSEETPCPRCGGPLLGGTLNHECDPSA